MDEKTNKISSSKSKYRFFSTIRKRLALLLLAILVPILIVQAIIYRNRFETRRQGELKDNLQIARTMSDTFQALLDDLLNQELSIGIALSFFKPLSAWEIRRLLKANKLAHPFLLNLSWVSPTGRIIAASDSPAGIDVSEQPFFREISAGRKWSVSNLSISEETGFPIFVVSRAVRGPAGDLSGFVVATVLADNLEAVFPIERYDGGAILIIDHSGRAVIRSPNVDWTWGHRNLLNRIPFVKEALAGTEITGTIVDDANKGKHLLALAPIRSIGWAVGASRLENQALSRVFSYLERHALLFSLVVCFSVLVFWLVANSISKPLELLQSHALDLGNGEPKSRINFKGPQELVKLAHALDFMAHELNLKIEALRQLNETLEQRVAERTHLAEVRTKQLQVLVSELTLAEQRERRRLAEILHDDLQQLLVGAKINSEILTAGIGPKQKQIAENVLSLVNKSIQTSRSLTAELAPPLLQQGRLSAALEWLARWMHKNDRLTVELQMDSGMDPDREDITILLFQSVRELLFNVVKHAGVKSARLEMSRDEENRLRVTVMDGGNGFDPNTIWEKARDGTGFGLFSIRERLELMGGSLEIESSAGNGASFSLVIPLEATEARKGKDETRIQKIMARIHNAKESGDKIRVLLADDHTVVRQGLSTMLDLHTDLKVVGEAADGEEAVEKARKLQPDVILMDISMPKMSGLQATRIIHSEFPHIRIIGLSMHDRQDQAAQMTEAGVSAYCTKDGATDVLLSAIRSDGEAGACKVPK